MRFAAALALAALSAAGCALPPTEAERLAAKIERTECTRLIAIGTEDEPIACGADPAPQADAKRREDVDRSTVTCRASPTDPDETLCLTRGQWTRYDRRRAGTSHEAALREAMEGEPRPAEADRW